MHFSAGQDVALKNYDVGTGVKSLDQVLIPALRRSYQDRCEVLFSVEGESHARQIWLTLRQSYTISTLSKSP